MTLAVVTPLYQGPLEQPFTVQRLHRYQADSLVAAGVTDAGGLHNFTNTDIIRARSRALCQMYRKGIDHLLFWDADVHAPVEQTAKCIRAMLDSGHDLVHVEYPRRGGGWTAHGTTEYVAGDRFTTARYVTMGFTLLTRKCIAAVLEAKDSARVAYRDHYDGERHEDAAVFALIINDEGLLLEEGYSFCERAAWVGITPHVYLGARMRHA
jgi:hypothetical protein